MKRVYLASVALVFALGATGCATGGASGGSSGDSSGGNDSQGSSSQ